ncbi:ubiquitin carboxyl-terminal hydrolase 5 [Coprinopsis cinerea AmutBmut pab1-1]|nr:ubiquitin carboxyl-terminal hydrolase 5 [Coprinopsis cinerea AmutBmut pab1-1]
MTSPHSPYGHGPGPSSYYHPSPPPHLYGSHSPGPGPNYSYQYPPPPPAHMTPSSTPPTRQNARGGSYSARNHNPYNYYHHHHQYPHHHHHHHHHHPAAVPLHAPNPHHHYSAKYNQPYSPAPYAPGFNPAAMPFTPPPRHTPQPHPPPPPPPPPQTTAAAQPPPPPPPQAQQAQQQQPLSPLPKQLSMPPPPNGFYDPHSRPPPPAVTLTHPLPDKPASSSSSSVVEAAGSPATATVTASAPLSPDPVAEESAPNLEEQQAQPEVAAAAPTSSYDSMGTIKTSDNVESVTAGNEASSSSTTLGSASSNKPATTVVNPVSAWAIWSRRPHDPSSAPGIIISPGAQPPQNIVDRAIDARTPPPSPTIRPKRVRRKVRPVADDKPVEMPPVQEEDTSVPSSVTETTDESTVPGSPVSSHTSVSASVVPVKEEEEAAAAKPETVVEEAEKAVEEPAPETKELSNEVPTVAVTSTSAQPEPAAPAAAATPAPAPAPPTPKKSWASLLRSAASADSTPSKNKLPTSSVVGISIPASALASSSSTSQSGAQPSTVGGVPVSPSKKTELINLLTGNPNNSTYTGRIKPKGLVNSGNMCFANSVLQILVYCAPFNRLFMELGRVLPLANGESSKEKTSSSSTSTSAAAAGSSSSASGSGSSSSSSTPLVDATALFLKEFVNEQAKRRGNGGAGVNGFSTSRGGKGKERERTFEVEDDDEWEMDSFLPTYIYDAMKEKKRFDTMRGGQQEDAEEFLGFYLDTLEEELLSILHSLSPSKPANPNNHVEEKEEVEAATTEEGWMEVGKKNRMVVTRTIKATESPITRIFGGKFRSTLRAPRQKDSVVVEDWRSLRLDIQRDQIRTIQDALSYISHPQPVQVTLPTHPGVPVEATQQVLIESLPPILVLHIKRFCYDTTVKGVVKVGKQVTFGPELEIGPDLMAPSVKKASGTRYKLFGALYHHGLSASGGHYTLDVLHPTRYPGSSNSNSSSSNSNANPNATSQNTANANANANQKAREGWIRIDDELVSDVRPEDVFGNQERDDSRCAYLLFYRRIW